MSEISSLLLGSVIYFASIRLDRLLEIEFGVHNSPQITASGEREHLSSSLVSKVRHNIFVRIVCCFVYLQAVLTDNE